ncbi:DoxX family membrane protein [Streptomyces sp. NRRL S-31]|uniref:DoxX family membrane protein n=1 Tax=Streptomyces sp. NRRL S-31 TaxID=1463898 RepID=UPI000699BD2C|nr:DoxX family membrane protein [Streptomyces sp. NRRL S-31]
MMTNRNTDRPSAATRPAPGHTPAHGLTAGDWGLLLLRLTFGLLMAGHGAQKLFGWFGGTGLTAVAKAFGDLGFHPARLFALIGGLSELLGGLGLAVGLLTPLAAAALVGVMINAMVTVTAAHGLWDTDGGVEYNVGIAVVAIAVAAIGPGRLSLDRFFPWGRGGWPAACVALGLGGIGAGITLSW